MKYKEDDKVKVRTDLVINEYYGSQLFVDDMEQYKGYTLTIAYSSGKAYLVKGNGWWWTDEMFENPYRPKKFTSEVVFK